MMEMQRINAAVKSGDFFRAEEIDRLIAELKKTGGTAHIIGLATTVGVHALLSHITAAARAFGSHDVPVAVHAFTDGRDSAPGMAPENLELLSRELPANATVATLSGRYFGMDRDRRWDRVQQAWQAIALADGRRANSVAEALATAAERGETDEFIRPTVIDGYEGLRSGDGVFIANFRSDRVRQIASALSDPDFSDFDTRSANKPVATLGMVPYFESEPTWIRSLFQKPVISNTLGECVSLQGLSQFRLAETEKYPHVTFFLNGGKERMEVGEERYMAQSPRVATYDLAPEMASDAVACRFAAAIAEGFDLVVMNFANPDMVGHTGDLSAAVKACEAVDRGLGKAVQAIDSAGGSMIVTADHGNCEMMIHPDTGAPHTAHTTNPVPVILFGDSRARMRHGRLSDLAPTLLELLNVDPPTEMTGRSLLR